MRIKLLGLLLSFSLLLCGCTGNTAEKKNSEEAVKKTQNVFAMNTYITPLMERTQNQRLRIPKTVSESLKSYYPSPMKAVKFTW